MPAYIRSTAFLTLVLQQLLEDVPKHLQTTFSVVYGDGLPQTDDATFAHYRCNLLLQLSAHLTSPFNCPKVNAQTHITL